MADESFVERQNDELQVLQAVFMSDYEDLRNRDAWKVARPPEICLKLKPQQSFGGQGGEVYAQLDLIMKCPARYPEVLPELMIDNVKGLSNQQVSALMSDLKMEAQKLCGQEMLLDLSQVVQAFLYANNKPPPKSFYEEMMSNNKRQEEKLANEQRKRLELLRKKEEKEYHIMEGQIQRQQEAWKEQTRRRKGETRQISPEPIHQEGHRNYSPIKACSASPKTTPHLPHDRRSASPSPAIVHNQDSENDAKPSRRRRTSTPRCADEDVLPHQCTCKHHTGGTVVLEFTTKGNRRVHRGTCLGHGKNGSTVYVGLETQTGDLVAVSEWVLKWRHLAKRHATAAQLPSDEDMEAEGYTRQVVRIEQELQSLLRLHHRNLVHYLAIKYQVDPGKITVWLLLEHAGGQSLEIYVTRKRLPLDALRAHTGELLEALEYLHNKAVVHRNLRASSVFVDHNGRIRLGDYSIDRRLGDLYQTIEEAKPGVKFSSDSRAPVIGRGGKKGDVYQLGVLLLSLAQGHVVEEMIPIIPTTLSTVFQDFLVKCLLKDDGLRWSTTQLLEHQFLNEPVPSLLTQHEDRQHVERQEDKPENDDDDEDSSQLITAWEASGQSRLTSEFDVMKLLGKGGFGDVIKVKNKLDGQVYAIKRIPLNPRSQHFNKKITREVKLLSRLNHENVVRYYNSWIETSDENAQSDTSSSISGTPKTSESESKLPVNKYAGKNSLDLTDDIEMFAPQIPEASDDGISYEASWSRSRGATEEESSDFEDEENDVFGLSFMHPFDEVSDCIVFEHNFDETDISSSQADTDQERKDSTEVSEPVAKLQYLYIQMEYCEKSTLRNCIDAGGLCQDMDRVWRLFREIVEGLLHIHEQGMIHRDLKPVNIFLDSNDHVKIGDFGLATSDIISKGSLKDTALLLTSAGDYSLSRSCSLGDGNLTGMVGTALYVSPEMMTGEHKVVYSQKVDIYSLGVMFFEMCYRPLETGMERMKILAQLRLKEINFPEDFDQVELENQPHIIRWLLNHEPDERPTSKELLQSELIPPAQMEEAELNEVLRATISDPHSKSYRRMLSAMFSQTISLADDHLYDSHIHKGSFSVKSAQTYGLVHDGVVRVFQRHGAIRLSTPLLIPRPTMYEDQFACFMDHSGKLVCLPFDLRVPFARFVARTNVHHMKRYCIDKVYGQKMFGFHPRELTQCAFDIVTSTPGSLIPDAEVMVVVQEIINEFPPLQQRNYYYRVNHTSLLKAVLLHANIPEGKHAKVLEALAEVKRDSRSRMKCLSNLSISEQKASALLNLLETEGPYAKVASILKTITKTKGPAGTFAKQGLHEIEAVVSNATNLGLKLPVTVSVGWVYSIQQFSGLIFEVAVDVTRKKKTVSEVFAAGGRYDGLISQFSLPLFSERTAGVRQSVVGVSVAFEKIISAMLEQEDYYPPSEYDVLVCTIGHKPMLKERMALVRDLWSAGIHAQIHLETLEGQEEIQDYCRLHGISQLVILKDSEGGTVKVRSIEREKITEKVVSTTNLVDFLQQKFQASKLEQSEANQTSASKNTAVVQTHINSTLAPTSSGSNLSMNFTFLQQEGKLASHTRRKYEALIVSKVTTSLPWLSVKCIEVVALDVTVQTLRLISAYLDLDTTEANFETSIGMIIEKQPRYKKYFSKVTDHIHSLVFEHKCNCIVLYGIKDDSVKLLTSS